ncbi:hypothetical protein FRC06_008620 [Ceratobasidium sp. 370]|nr:hypothetical protein FRC06_008620 [Ceratobasidium sp. 370]
MQAQTQLAGGTVTAPRPKLALDIPAPNGHSAPSPPHSPPTPITFNQSQLNTLRSQISALKYLQHGLPVPLEILNAIFPSPAPPTATSDAKTATEDTSDQLTAPPGNLLENDTTSLIYPYNPYTHPTTRLATAKNSHAIVPSITPLGLDPFALQQARERFIDACIAQCICKLSALPSTMGEPEPENGEAEAQDSSVVIHPSASAHSKLGALVELKGLQLRARQQALRRTITNGLYKATTLPTDRSTIRRFRCPTLCDVHHMELLERQQRKE